MTGEESNAPRKFFRRPRGQSARQGPSQAGVPRQIKKSSNTGYRPGVKKPKEPRPDRGTPASHPKRLQYQYFAEAEPLEPGRRGVYPASVSAWAPSGSSVGELSRRWFHILAFHYPARLTIAIFAILIVIITSLLMLPIATPPGDHIGFVDAFFTAVSAVCVTGLTVVNTATAWTFFGEAVILTGIALGGLGVMTMASLLALVVSRRLGLTQRLLVQSDTQSRIGETTSLIWGVIVATAIAVSGLFVVILPTFIYTGHSVPEATWNAFFTAVSTFNNAGFINLPEGLEAYASNWLVLIPLAMGAFVGAIGFPVIVDVRRNWRRPGAWTLHTKLTLSTFLIVAVSSTVLIVGIEWNNPSTFGALSFSDKILNGIMEMVTPRSVGISAVDITAMTGGSWLITDLSMFIGGGSGSHAGGIKVTTFAVLLLAAWAEARGRRDAQTFHRRIPNSTVRQAVAVLLAGVTLILTVTVIMMVTTPFTLDRVLFEVISAFGTVGLSTGITPALPVSAKLLLSFLMIVGRVGPMTLAAALALRERGDAIRMPEARPIVG